MRTTLTIDDDVANKLMKLSASQQKSFKEVVNTALRKGLASPSSLKQPGAQPIKLTSRRLPYCRGIDELKIKERLDELDAQDSLLEP